jgi:hypothetical protein
MTRYRNSTIRNLCIGAPTVDHAYEEIETLMMATTLAGHSSIIVRWNAKENLLLMYQGLIDGLHLEEMLQRRLAPRERESSETEALTHGRR